VADASDRKPERRFVRAPRPGDFLQADGKPACQSCFGQTQSGQIVADRFSSGQNRRDLQPHAQNPHRGLVDDPNWADPHRADPALSHRSAAAPAWLRQIHQRQQLRDAVRQAV
jgi:hypothetical protein